MMSRRSHNLLQIALVSLLASLGAGSAGAQTFSVSSDGSCASSSPLTAGTLYEVRASGVWSYHGCCAGHEADAEWCQNPHTGTWCECYMSDDCTNDTLELVWYDNCAAERLFQWEGFHNGVWALGQYSPTHEYRTFHIGKGGPLQMRIKDFKYRDNSGSLTVTVTEVGPSVAYRNAGTNPSSLTALTYPILGTTFTCQVDLGGTTGHDYALLVGYEDPLTFAFTGGQVMLVDSMGTELLGTVAHAGPQALWHFEIPGDETGVPVSDLSLCGLRTSLQAVHFGGVTPFALSNALDVTLAY